MHFQNVSPTKIHWKITEVYGPQVKFRKNVSVWCTKFNSDREKNDDHKRSGLPTSTFPDKIIAVVEQLLRSDRRLKIR